MSLQNEPDFASCGTIEPCSGDYATTLFTAEEMVAFVKVVGPKLRALNPPVKVLAPEASEWIHNALTAGEAEAWCWWWWKASSPGNSGLLASDETDTKRHYTFGNFTRFVRPGYTRVDITGDVPKDLLLSAYKGNGTIVIVAINKGTESVTVRIAITGGTAPASLTPWVTSASDNLKSKAPVTVSGNTFTPTLAGKTVTTFVGNE